MGGAAQGHIRGRGSRAEGCRRAGEVAGDLLERAVLRLAPQPGLLPVQVELVLGDGGLPDALGQAGGRRVPYINMD